MAVSTQRPVLTSALFIIRDTDADGTSEDNVTAGAATIYAVQINNSANASASSYVKFYNNAAPTVGTTAPDMILMAAGGATTNYAFPKGNAVFTTALSYACVTTAGTAGTTNPTSDVVVIMVVA